MHKNEWRISEIYYVPTINAICAVNPLDSAQRQIHQISHTDLEQVTHLKQPTQQCNL
jgi:hypothetical protein